jgi:hypothetical protein
VCFARFSFTTGIPACFDEEKSEFVGETTGLIHQFLVEIGTGMVCYRNYTTKRIEGPFMASDWGGESACRVYKNTKAAIEAA